MVTKYLIDVCCLLLSVACLGVVGLLQGDHSTSTGRRQFATKSHYPFYKDDDESLFGSPANCTALHINMVLRHGTRYPGLKDIKGINKMADFVNQYFSEEAPGQFGELTLPWINGFQYGNKMLAQKGAEEMYNISRRLLKQFPSLFPQYFGEKHYFVSTSTPRSSQSASAFAFGLFEGTGMLGQSRFQPVSITTVDLLNPVLRFFDVCEKYKMEVSKNKASSLQEFWRFKNGQEMQQVRRRIKDRLSIPSELTSDHVQHMFLSCAYEIALHGSGQWCSVFEDDDVDVVEYLYDIKNYWKRGHGYKINYEMSCLLLNNLTQSVQDVVRNHNKSHTLAIFHFAHAETLIPLLCILGLFNNTEPLQAGNYDRQKDRQFRTANMAPFSGNVAVILYSCGEDNKNHNSMFYVQVLVNEQVAGLPCCHEKELCPFQQFLDCFKNFSQSCNLLQICDHGENNHTEHHAEL